MKIAIFSNSAPFSKSERFVNYKIKSTLRHRKDMPEACPLTFRQSLAYLLPIISGYKDTDIEATENFELENFEDNIYRNINKIDNFIIRSAKHEHIRSEIPHSPSEELLVKKMEERYLFFEETVRRV